MSAAFATFVSSLRNGSKLFERRDDDGFDRLSNRYSVGIIIMMAGFIGVKTYTGEPIACIPPSELTTIPWRKFVDMMCWTTNNYYVAPEEEIPAGDVLWQDTTLERYKGTIQYYQYTPFLLFFVAVMFAAPGVVWSWASNTRGYDVAAIVKATRGTNNINPEVRDKTVRYLIAQMDRLLGYRRCMRQTGFLKKLKLGKRRGCFLFVMYLLTKVLYIANAGALIWVINAFIGKDYSYYGLDMIKELRNPDFKGSERFPYSTLCDFWLRKTGQNVQRYTVQCVLSANLFNEKIFMMIWFWSIFVAAASALGLFLWAFTAVPQINRTFARKYLAIMGRDDSIDDDLLEDFVFNYLRLDGVFCMRLIVKNTNDAIGGEIIAACWDHFLHTRRAPSFEPTTTPTISEMIA